MLSDFTDSWDTMKNFASDFFSSKTKPFPQASQGLGRKEYFSDLMNQVYHGDFLEMKPYLADLRFDVVIADPPYNIGKDFGNNKDSMPIDEYISWSKEWLSVCQDSLSEQGIIYVYGFPEILAHIATSYPLSCQRWLVWHYTNKAVPGLKFWQRSHESILCLWKGKRPDLEIDQIRENYTESYLRLVGTPRKETKGRYNTKGKSSVYNGHENGALPRDVIKIPALAGGAGSKERWFLCKDCGNRVFSPEHLQEHASHDIVKHPTQKPMQLTKRLLLSRINGKGGNVLIPFAGSGSECVVAQALGLNFFAAEINKDYVTLAKKILKHKIKV